MVKVASGTVQQHQTVTDNNKYRVMTGTFTGITAAQVGANKIKTAKLAQVIQVVAG